MSPRADRAVRRRRSARRSRARERRAPQRRPKPSDFVLHLLAGPRNGLQALTGDRLAGDLADAVGPQRDLGQGVVDLVDRRPGLVAEGQVALALHRQRVALTRLLVELDVAGLAQLGQRIGLGLERVGLAEVGGPLLDEDLALALDELELGRRQLALGRSLGRGLGRRGLLGRRLGRRRLGRRLLGRRPSWPAPSSPPPWPAPSWPEPSWPELWPPPWPGPSSPAALAGAFFAGRLGRRLLGRSLRGLGLRRRHGGHLLRRGRGSVLGRDLLGRR